MRKVQQTSRFAELTGALALWRRHNRTEALPLVGRPGELDWDDGRRGDGGGAVRQSGCDGELDWDDGTTAPGLQEEARTRGAKGRA
ncbi:hypothetical protein GUJ93_ZPchr0004g38509 [Zizania palustris]|uniref:Uncharacterized protein n=1 Tax=Zizania palustris TaxID=103762 RepID=A0A8J5V8E2_ZIZPA|nr:hypothetical protein GUJ93_ZPchr0004g38509 [Zizania palustris]